MSDTYTLAQARKLIWALRLELRVARNRNARRRINRKIRRIVKKTPLKTLNDYFKLCYPPELLDVLKGPT